MFVSWWIIGGLIILILCLYRSYSTVERQLNLYRKEYYFNNNEFMIWVNDNLRNLEQLQNIDIDKLEEAHRILTQECRDMGIDVSYSVETAFEQAMYAVKGSNKYLRQLRDLSVYKTRHFD